MPGLASGLADAAGGRHLLMWAAEPSEQSAWQALGVDGALRPESLLVAVQNRGGNKLDRFLHVAAELSVTSVGDESEVTLTLNLRNEAPVGEPQYIVGPHALSGVGEGVYVGILTVSFPGDASGGRLDGVDTLAVEGADGPSQVMGFQFELPRGGERTVVARFRLPSRGPILKVEPSARVPAIAWRSGALAWSDTSAKILSS